jgi:hypothetical protein
VSKLLQDEELNSYRDLVQAPGYFEEGFTWRAILGTLFVALVMLPAAMYMHLMIGGGIGPAAQWVTVILFLEMAKRARSFLRPAEIYILFGLIGVIVGHSPAEGFFWRQYLVQSDAVQSFGLTDQFPSWYAPSNPAVLDQRTFFHAAWVIPLLILFLQQVVDRLDSMVLGYGLFRIASDVERLPFPMATMGASGILAVTEDATDRQGWRWRCFSLASAMGMVFGFIYVGIPTITSTFMDTPFQILPIPWLETSPLTEKWFPATATGFCFDAGNFFVGMALPFFAVVGAFVGMIITLILNPYLYDWGILKTWQPGETTVQILFENNLDFYLSFGIGISLTIFILGVYQIIQGLRMKKVTILDGAPKTMQAAPTRGVRRGDIRPVFIIGMYLFSSTFYILLCGILLDWRFSGHYFLVVLLFFALVYIPLISYVTARLEGLAGQVLALPMIREIAFILSRYKGIEIWLLPVPLTANYGVATVNYRIAELVGCSFRSYWKTIVVVPVIFLCSLIYGNFIWSLDPIPSAPYPFAMEMWDLHARNQLLTISATNDGFSPFMFALRWQHITLGAVAGLGTYMLLAFFGLPILLLYGTVKGLGQSTPQMLITQFAGALFGRFVMETRFGTKRWRQYTLVLSAGFSCGTGLMMMLATGVKFLKSAVFHAPF